MFNFHPLRFCVHKKSIQQSHELPTETTDGSGIAMHSDSVQKPLFDIIYIYQYSYVNLDLLASTQASNVSTGLFRIIGNPMLSSKPPVPWSTSP